jgi:hypothetical protein
VTGSAGALFRYGLVVGVLAMVGLSLLPAGSGRTSRRRRAACGDLEQSRP